MSRPGRLAFSIAPFLAAVFFAAIVADCPAGETASPAGWQASGPRGQNQSRGSAPSRWTSNRPRLADVASEPHRSQPPSAQSMESVTSEPAWTKPTTSKRSTAAASGATGQSTAPRWVLPSQRAANVAPNAKQSTKQPVAASKSVSNSVAGQARVHQAPREPKAFVPPTDAPNIPSTRSTGEAQQQARASDDRRVNGAPAVAQAAATPIGHASTRTNQAPHRHRAAQGRRVPVPKRPSYATRLREAVSVTFEGPERWAAFQEAEDLPLPGGIAGEVVHEGSRMMPREGEIIHEDGYEMMGPEFAEGYGNCGDGTCHPGGPGYGCGDACEPGCDCDPSCGCGGQEDLFCVGWGDNDSCHTVRFRLPKWQELTFFGGVHGFKGPYDRARDSGNFGFHEGLNAGFKVPYSTFGYQVGYQAVHSQLHGDKDTDISDPHTQHFLTAGLFHRVQDGFQGGVVWDMLRDERWGSVDFHQLRTELSFVDHGCHELGFAGTFHLNEHERGLNDEEENEVQLQSMVWQASDQYLLFYRFHGKRGGEGRVYAGFNDNDDGILGTDMILPVNDRWSVQTGFTYLIPDDEAGHDGAANEAWNIGLGLVWHYGCRARASHSSCYRPLFNVADNGTLIVDGRPGASVVNGAQQEAQVIDPPFTTID